MLPIERYIHLLILVTYSYSETLQKNSWIDVEKKEEWALSA